MGKVDVVIWKWRDKLPRKFLEELNDALAYDEVVLWDMAFSMGVDSALGFPLSYLADRLYELKEMLKEVERS